MLNFLSDLVEYHLLSLIAGVFTILWLVGVKTGHTGWGAIHVLLVLAIPLFAIEISNWWLEKKMNKQFQEQQQTQKNWP